jgi:hypothetical protein
VQLALFFIGIPHSINLLFHNIENAEFLLKKFSKSAIHAGLRDFLIGKVFVYNSIP